MRKYFSVRQIMFVLCLLFSVGILFFGWYQTAYAAGNVSGLTDGSNATGVTDERTNINEPGTADDPEELRELNVANNLTITYNNGNGTVAGPVRILVILTMIGLAPMLLIMLTAYKNGVKYPDSSPESGSDGDGAVSHVFCDAAHTHRD